MIKSVAEEWKSVGKQDVFNSQHQNDKKCLEKPLNICYKVRI